MVVYYTFLQYKWSNDDQQMVNYISEVRKNKVDAFYLEKDKKLSLYAGLLTRMMLSCELGLKSNKLIFEYGECGKPKLFNLANIHFNLTHSGKCVACCMSNKGSIGIDVEVHTVVPFEIMGNCFHTDEINVIKQAEEKEEKFYEIWTKKEAFLKKEGIGLTDKMTQQSIYNLNSSILYGWKERDYTFAVCSEHEEVIRKYFIGENQIVEFFMKSNHRL